MRARGVVMELGALLRQEHAPQGHSPPSSPPGTCSPNQPAGEASACVLLHPGGAAAPRASVAARRWDGGTSARVRSVPVDLPSLLGALGGPGWRETLVRLGDQVLD
ncbi:hypothetical protein [Streptomyces sp. NPDC021622]|uniref:hypothetical protein n=1 Tax=Streptomyces sp. NPDC021622 TaxID=3155013 RepID=UPI0033C0931D